MGGGNGAGIPVGTVQRVAKWAIKLIFRMKNIGPLMLYKI